uniref:Uncharacterized protein n=1 Tax=Trichogramma kaykai TaxID=54128 RepID=A0ABD2WFC0_9HYME
MTSAYFPIDSIRSALQLVWDEKKEEKKNNINATCRLSGAQIVRAIGSMDLLPLLFVHFHGHRVFSRIRRANELRHRARPILLSSFVSFTPPQVFPCSLCCLRKTCSPRLAGSQDRTFDCFSTSRKGIRRPRVNNLKASNSRIAKLFSSKDRQCDFFFFTEF